MTLVRKTEVDKVVEYVDKLVFKYFVDQSSEHNNAVDAGVSEDPV